MRSLVANLIRLTFSEPPALASEDAERRAIYTASLLMCEELLEAAREVDYLARPLPLYYALSQAGRAIVAAYGPEPSVRGHGLTEESMDDPITGVRIAPQNKQGLFGAVAKAMDASTLTGPVELGAVWSAIPDLAYTPHGADDWPRAVFVWQERPDAEQWRFDYSSVVLVHPAGPGPSALLVDELTRYPHAEHAIVTGAQGIQPGALFKRTPRGEGVTAWFEDQEGRPVRADTEVPPHRLLGERWLIPRLPGGEFLPPLLLWWVLLFGLSILARYEPARWRRALDVETPLAVPLEDLLDEALVAVPHWLLWALTGQEVQVPRPADA